MNFENVAYLFDSTTFRSELKMTVDGIISFVGNPIYITAYAKDAVDKFDFVSYEGNDFDEWLKVPKNNEAFIPFMLKLYEDVAKLGIVSFFIEKEYSAFVCLLELMCSSINIGDLNFRKYLDKLFLDYQSEYKDSIICDSIDETVTLFNQRIDNLLQIQKGIGSFKSILIENRRELDNQIRILDIIEKVWGTDFRVFDYFFYSNQLIKKYNEAEIKSVYVSSIAAQRFIEMANRSYDTTNIIIRYFSKKDEDYDAVASFARFIMMVSRHYIEKMICAKDIETFSDDDKYLFVIVWMALQSGDSNMFINSRSYEVIKEVFMSLKKEMNV